jgi:hypothetical protein
MLAGSVPFLLSADLLAEYRQVLLRPAIARAHGLDAEEIDELLVQIVLIARSKAPTRRATRISSPFSNPTRGRGWCRGTKRSCAAPALAAGAYGLASKP